MATNRDTYKYHFKKGNRIVHIGITNDLERRETEHRQERGGAGAKGILSRWAIAPPAKPLLNGSGNKPRRDSKIAFGDLRKTGECLVLGFCELRHYCQKSDTLSVSFGYGFRLSPE